MPYLFYVSPTDCGSAEMSGLTSLLAARDPSRSARSRSCSPITPRRLTSRGARFMPCATPWPCISTRRVTSLVVVLSVVVVGFMIGPNLIRRLGPPAPVSVDEPVERLPLGDAYRKIASAVGMLVFNNQASCTAWLVSDEDLMTTDYCVPRLGAGAQRLVLRLGFLSPQASPLEYVVDPRPIEQDPELGYAILRVEGNPAERFGVLRLDTRDPEPGEGLFVLHHSLGKPLALARGNACSVTTAQIDPERNFGYTCNTHEGSGGAPVIAVSDLRILGLHHSSSRREAWSVARRFRLILERSRTLQAIVAGTSRRN
jgi:hypothetical protein